MPDQANNTKQLQWFVYVVRCAENSLYRGIAKDVYKRIYQHNYTNKGAKYTRCRRNVMCVYMENHPTRSSALIREAEIKKLSKRSKEKLIAEWMNQVT